MKLLAQDTRSRQEVLDAIRRSIRTALRYAFWLFLLGIVRSIAEHGGLSPVLLFVGLLFTAGAVVVGVIVGLLQPLTGTLHGSMLVGVIAVFPGLLAITFIGAPDTSLAFKVKASLLLAMIMGSVYALALWEKPAKRKK